MKITAIQSDLSGGGALGFLKVKYSDSDDWQFITLSEDPDDSLWNWDDSWGDSDILSLESYQFITGVYWFNKSENDIGAIQQIGFDIYDVFTGTTTQTQLDTWYDPVDVFDESLSTTGSIKATSGNHITSFEGLDPVKGSGWGGYVPTDLGIVSEEIVPSDVTPPVLSSAATNTDGTKVVLTFNEVLSSTTADVTAFEVTTDGSENEVTSVDINFDENSTPSRKITAIQSDLSGGGALGFLKVKYSDSDDWQFITLSEDPDDSLWN